MPDSNGMKTLLLVLLTAVVAGCSTGHPTVRPVVAASDLSGTDLSGRWTGTWRGFGLLMAPREDAVTLEIAQNGDLAEGRFALEGTAAAESVPIAVRNAGLWGIRVRAKISGDKVTLRHQAGGHLFTADLKLTADGEHLYGLVRGGHPRVALVLTRAPEGATTPPSPPPPQAAMATPAPALRQGETTLGKVEPAPKVVVIAPDQKESDAPAPSREDFTGMAELLPIHFDFDKAELRKDAVDTLTAHVAWLKDHADAVLLIEGHCDERGTDEYNVALGERRAKSVGDLLAAHGIAPDRISTTSLGRERPVCTANTEDCRMQNRRAEFRIKTR
jgi:peptidoglycan-associated lipoprotein